jgi:lipoprotein LprG
MIRRLNILIAIICLSILMAVLVACGGSKATSATTAAPDVIALSSAEMQTLNSYHFVLDQVGGGTPIGMGVEMKAAEGDIVKPDKLITTITGSFAGMTLEVQVISVGGVMEMTNPLTGKWETPSATFNVLSLFDPNTGVAAILKGLSGVSKLADAQTGGVLCYHLSGSVKSEDLAAITGSSVAGTSIDTEVWIGKDDLFVRQIKLTGQITSSEVKGIVRTLSLSSFNNLITIELPK